MQDGSDIYTPRETVEDLLSKTLDIANGKPKSAPAGKARPTPAKVVRRVAYGLVIVALLGMLGKVWIAKVNGRVPDLFGYQLYVVETGSMIPTLPIGSTLLVQILQPGQQPQVGDIITYSRDTSAITHRIREEIAGDDGATRWQTQGDNPDNSADPWLVSLGDVRGIVTRYIPWPWLSR